MKVLDFGLAKALDADGVQRSRARALADAAALADRHPRPGRQAGLILGTAGVHGAGAGARRAVDTARRHLGVRRRCSTRCSRAGACFEGGQRSDTLAAVLRQEVDLGRTAAATPAAAPRRCSAAASSATRNAACATSARRAS